jgi:hypothetical protein
MKKLIELCQPEPATTPSSLDQLLLGVEKNNKIILGFLLSTVGSTLNLKHGSIKINLKSAAVLTFQRSKSKR